MNIETQKSILIEQFKQVDDENLINAIKSLLDYALKKKEDIIEIPQSHQDLVIRRFEESRKDPERLLDWDEAKMTLNAE